MMAKLPEADDAPVVESEIVVLRSRIDELEAKQGRIDTRLNEVEKTK